MQKDNRALKKSVENWQERLVEMLRDVMLEKARTQIGDVARLAAEVAEHKRDPYTVVEELAEGGEREVQKQVPHRRFAKPVRNDKTSRIWDSPLIQH